MPQDIKLQPAQEGKGLSTHDFTTEHKTKVDAIPENPKYSDTVYAHPAKHPASIFEQDSENRLVTDAQIERWDNHRHDSVQTVQNAPLKFSRLTQADYDALAMKDADTLYLIVE